MPSICLCLFLLYLTGEALLLRRRRNRIGLRIAVTGTRGKTTVARSLAAVCRADSRTVFAKTTGSEAAYLLPDGRITPVHRRGLPSIIEQKETVRRAAAAGADTLVAEIMSIHPENHAVESRLILRPHIVVITNIRLDHTDAMGTTRDDIAAVLAETIPAKAAVFIPECEVCDPIVRAVKQRDCRLVAVPSGHGDMDAGKGTDGRYGANSDLVLAVARHLGIDENRIAEGIAAMIPDAGGEEIRVVTGRGKTLYLINGFAANDPESTFLVLERMKSRLPAACGPLAGLLTLRGDRSERTAQWLTFLTAGEAGNPFASLYVTGRHAGIFRRRVPGARILETKDPRPATERLLAELDDGAVVFGFGNMAGPGERLAAYWRTTGDLYDR
ncbi:poly-gamma-glutamate synthase PgsB [bacterium]|nr:poly-gamma-glutamate synthase PgsB [bacterium]